MINVIYNATIDKKIELKYKMCKSKLLELIYVTQHATAQGKLG